MKNPMTDMSELKAVDRAVSSGGSRISVLRRSSLSLHSSSGATTFSGAVTIRLATASDRDKARGMFRRTHEKTPFSIFPFSDSEYDHQWALASEVAPHKVLLVAERDGLLVGALWASCGRYFVSNEGIMTTVHGIVLDDDLLSGFGRVRTFRRLLKAVQKWSARRGARFVTVSNTTGFKPNTTDRLLRGIGATIVGGSYVCIDT